MSKTIIDGIDVSECEHFKINKGFNCYKGHNCTDKECSDCYYKQLQRLKHQYADVLKLAKENADSNEYCLQELEKEYEHLKKCCTQAGEELSKHSFKWDGKEKNLVIQAMELNERFEKYQQALQEIKEIAGKLMADNLCNNCDGIGLDSNCQDTGCPYYQMDRILDLITKAESEG